MVEAKSNIRVLHICGLGSNSKGSKPTYLQRHFEHVALPQVKHASYTATKVALAEAVRDFRPDIVTAHSAGVGKAMTLATSGAWSGPLVLLAGGRGCAPVSDLLDRAVTVVIPKKDPDAQHQRRAVQLAQSNTTIVAIEVDDTHDLNTTMVDGDMLRQIIIQTMQRSQTRPELGSAEPENQSPPEVTRSISVQDHVRWLFSESDLNRDGFVTSEEFRETWKRVCPQVSDDKILAIMDAQGRDMNGNLDIDEFLSWVFSADAASGKALYDLTSGSASSSFAPPEESLAACTDAALAVDAATSSLPRREEISEEAETNMVDATKPGDVQELPIRASDAVATAPKNASSPSAQLYADVRRGALRAGQLFTWGRGSDGQLGQDRIKYPGLNCALPAPVPSLRRVVHVACGGGQQGCTAAVTEDGALFTFGNNYKARLGHGDGPCIREPRRVDGLASMHVLMASCGTDHSGALVRGGRVFCWGSNSSGQLGLGSTVKGVIPKPTEVMLLAPALHLDCEDGYSAAILEGGRLFTWGCNVYGRLGIGSAVDQCSPVEAPLGGLQAAYVSLGSLYAGAVGTDGELLMWGYGGHGNLGLGDRASVSVPTRVELGERAWQVSCTRGQVGCKGGLNPKIGGQEGPHTVVVAASGALYTMGTCHKGLLCNLGSKDGAFGRPWDELRPYRVGGKLRNGSENAPLSPLAVWPPPYDSIGPCTMAVSAHIHCACIDADGRAWAWGCGSNDGRCGVERYLNMKGEGKPPEIDMMKCYMMGPHRIGLARALYWKHPSLQGMRVSFLATGRNHMACIASPLDIEEP